MNSPAIVRYLTKGEGFLKALLAVMHVNGGQAPLDFLHWNLSRAGSLCL
jgi:hypothetical protein